jgi:putative aldouronate transport system substrate-binding protein
MPKTFAELTETYEYIMANWEGPSKPYYPSMPMSSFGPEQKAYPEWPFVVYDKVFYVDQSGNVQNFFETEVFKRNCANARLWFEKGIISPDVLTTTSDQINNMLDSGDWIVQFGSRGDIGPMKANYPDLTVEDFVAVDFAPEKPRVRPYGARNMNAVPLASEHPESAVKFFNWLYSSQDNYDLFIYGREDIDYEKAGERNRIPINDPVTGQPPYSFADWMAGNLNFIRTSLTAPKATNETLYTLNPTAVEGYAAQFTFNAESVQTQYTDVQTAISAEIIPIASGVKDYDSNIDKALEELKAAGVDELVIEFKRQLEAGKQ